MGNKKSCSCSYWNEAQQECLYVGDSCIRDDQKITVTKEFIGKVTARIYCDRRSVKAIKTNIRKAFEEAGVEVVAK